MNLTQAQTARLKVICNFLLAVYVGSYLVLSLTGNYMNYPVASYKYRIDGLLPLRDVLLWQPKGTVLTSINCNCLGALYSPFIWVDRRCWHRNRNVYFDKSVQQ
jgi:hypothetical protein